MRKKDLTGKRFGRLVVVKQFKEEKTKRPIWVTKCDCGKTKNVRSGDLTKNKTQSCGCIRKERNNNTRHNKSGTKIYMVWQAMKKRCTNKNDKSYKNYGGRGITICDEWMTFDNFFKNMGDKPFKDAQIDRIDNNKGYSPDNCRWTTPKVNANNKRKHKITCEGESHTLKEWSTIKNININTLASRIYEGWNIEDALNKPTKKMG